MSGQIVVDYEELHRMSRVWSAASETLARLAMAVAELAASPAIFANAIFDPLGATRSQAAIGRAAMGRAGLVGLAAALAVDAVHLDAVVAREQFVDDFPASRLAAVGRWMLTASYRLPIEPLSTVRAGGRDFGALADAAVGYLAPFTEPLLERFAPAPIFRLDAAEHRSVDVDPVFDIPLATVGRIEPQGPGSATVAGVRPSWSATAPTSLADAMSRVSDLESQPKAEIAVQAITGADGVRRYVIELPGIRSAASKRQPQDLLGAIDAMADDDTTYTRCVREAIDSAGVPVGAQVMLVGHSDGGIVAMDLAADPSFNGSRVQVTHVVAAGAPISGKAVLPGSATRVLSVENVNDIVTHLDAVDSMDQAQTTNRLTYQYSDDDHDVGANHACVGYVRHMESLATSPNPLMRQFQGSVQPYLWAMPGATSTMVFAVSDEPAR